MAGISSTTKHSHGSALDSITIFTMARKRNSLTPWDMAKPHLEEGILAGTIPQNMPPREEVRLQIEYGQAEYKNFVTNLRNLQKALKVLGNTSIADDLLMIGDSILSIW
jgi:hypothetical protein